MITLTPKAREKIEEIANECGEPYFVRCVVKGGGCAGTTNDLFFSDIVGELDEVYEFEGVSIAIDPFSHGLLGDFTIEYLDGLMEQGFKFAVDGSTHTSCGCGHSTGLI